MIGYIVNIFCYTVMKCRYDLLQTSGLFEWSVNYLLNSMLGG